MTRDEAAERLNGSEYGQEGSKELFAEMKEAGLVAVFGASDDLMEFRGAINDEIGAWDGTTAYLTKAGLLSSKCDDDCPYFFAEQAAASKIDAGWAKLDDYSWSFTTSIPHATFEVTEDDENYCRGIVFSLADVPAEPPLRH